MTIPTLFGVADVQAVVIARLLALVANGTLPVGTSIAEFSYQGVSYVYPCVRVRISSLTPVYRAGSCQPHRCAFEIICYSELPSSAEADSLAKAVRSGFDSWRMTVLSTQSTPVRTMQVIAPVPLTAERGWAAHVLYECELP